MSRLEQTRATSNSCTSNTVCPVLQSIGGALPVPQRPLFALVHCMVAPTPVESNLVLRRPPFDGLRPSVRWIEGTQNDAHLNSGSWARPARGTGRRLFWRWRSVEQKSWWDQPAINRRLTPTQHDATQHVYADPANKQPRYGGRHLVGDAEPAWRGHRGD